jgi:hypothetical protein
MIPKILIAMTLCGGALGQAPTPWPCQGELHKADPKAMFRVNDGVTNKIADTKVLPEISDLKGRN